jgi:hypothetical protein
MFASRMNLLFLLLAVASSVQGFSVSPIRTTSTLQAHQQQRLSTPLYSEMSSDDTDIRLGETERLLLERKRTKDLGLKQTYGVTVKKDGLDGVRAAVWGVFHASNVVFPVLGAAFFAGVMLNMMGYAYSFENGSVVIDSMQHIRQEQFFQMEAARLTASAVETVSETLQTM